MLPSVRIALDALDDAAEEMSQQGREDLYAILTSLRGPDHDMFKLPGSSYDPFSLDKTISVKQKTTAIIRINALPFLMSFIGCDTNDYDPLNVIIDVDFGRSLGAHFSTHIMKAFYALTREAR